MGTIAPFPYHQFFDNNGDPASGYQLFTYNAGLASKLGTFSDSALLVPNTNPIILDSSGRSPIFLSPDSYKFVLASPTDTDPPTSPIWTIDNVSAAAPTFPQVDVAGTLGEAGVAAGKVLYLSRGEGGRTAGSWYKASFTQEYSSVTADAIGFSTESGSTPSSIPIRMAGRVTGLAGLIVSDTYWIDSNGSITNVAPASNARAVGQADTTTSLVVSNWVPIPDATATVKGRVSLGTANTWTVPQIGGVTFARTTANFVKNANTTFGDVTGLAFAVGANETWAFDMSLKVSGAAAADIKFQLTGPAAPTAVWFGAVQSLSSALTSFSEAFSTPFSFELGGAGGVVHLTGLLRNGANAGTVQLQAAQVASVASDTIILAESYLIARRPV